MPTRSRRIIVKETDNFRVQILKRSQPSFRVTKREEQRPREKASRKGAAIPITTRTAPAMKRPAISSMTRIELVTEIRKWEPELLEAGLTK